MKNIKVLLFVLGCIITFPACKSASYSPVLQNTAYQLAPNQAHYYLIPIKGQGSLDILDSALKEFHQQTGYDELGIIKLELEGMEAPILVVRGRFTHLNEVLPYEEALTPFLREHQRNILFSAPIALINYQTLIKSKDLKGYQRFLSEY